MTWKLWLDDQSYDPDAPARHPPEGFVSAVRSAQALALIREFGFPEFIDFDHDLSIGPDGETDTAMKLLRALEREYDLASIAPPGYRIHSANGEGAKNIESFMESWRRVWGTTA